MCCSSGLRVLTDTCVTGLGDSGEHGCMDSELKTARAVGTKDVGRARICRA